MMLAVEYLAVALNISFVVFIGFGRIWGWIAGIIGSLLSAWLFLDAQLYSEFGLYIIYALFGIYGWWNWNRTSVFSISLLPTRTHVILIATGLGVGLLAGFLFERFSKAALPFADALSSSFGLLATWLEAKKILHHWLYWIVINAFSVWLYSQRGLNILAAQMTLFFLLSLWGWFKWKHKFATQ